MFTVDKDSFVCVCKLLYSMFSLSLLEEESIKILQKPRENLQDLCNWSFTNNHQLSARTRTIDPSK